MNRFNSRRPWVIYWYHQLLRSHRHVCLLLCDLHVATVQAEPVVEEVRHPAADGTSDPCIYTIL
jgi:hypothetical protein